MDRLRGRTVIVTGAARGIGASYARALAAEGANVAACDVLDTSNIVAEIGGNSIGGTCDVSSRASVEAFTSRVLDRFGRIDGLVNNGALFASLKRQPFEQIESEEFDRVMQVNVRGTFEFCRAVMPAMRAQGYGKIVNTSSGTVFKGITNMLHYVSSKGAVIALTRVIAREAGSDGVRVNCLAPGFTLSDGVQSRDPDELNVLSTMTLASRCLPRDQMPEDLNGAVVFLLSADSDFISGQTLVVDGGSVMH
ncbi:MAG: SDR family oxidoreductase [Mesorhizobium sp.]|uniref:SDR family NAD(P)-dependent oxidoreductase n=2 Tax=Mesorhizobium TaxID=68287 RepID=UPI000F7649AE|nr:MULTISPECIES: SDR family oxidoreductase [unclassified Mesorhizobium]AZO33610.1 SDR family oxidoreductase [Mesorhizobium sp. M2A.F.Ca.ET.046.03.2.1]RVC80741.1 SDR family oxidoreductase [Mesorhizobium sp. M2A.F.Ca.ET.046.02.1.1]RWB38738.1 MAG: SDR family oxidoreductase [Mesorhizobium sp.]RWE22190.1 MAG: SDR family oxidoreductase [Mesorhizobium sp.]